MECDYVKEIGGDIAYKKGFQRIIDKENLPTHSSQEGKE
jgi:hypothetical protein